MRRIEIIEEPTGPRRWIAIDQATRQPLLRLFNFDQLRNRRAVGLEVVEAQPQHTGRVL